MEQNNNNHKMFQFTHPGRGATSRVALAWSRYIGFNSRTPGGVRLDGFFRLLPFATVSIHAPREGCDPQVGDDLPF